MKKNIKNKSQKINAFDKNSKEIKIRAINRKFLFCIGKSFGKNA